MTIFQLFASLVFAALVAAAYGKDIYARLRANWPAVKLPPPVDSQILPKEVVNDLLIVAAMRDRFLADGCKEGAEACSVLLKILIDHKHPHSVKMLGVNT